MATRRRQQRLRHGEAYWRELLSRHPSSGLDVLAFCQCEAVSTASFYRWRARLGDGGEAVAVRDAPAFVDLGGLAMASRGGNALELRLDLGAGLVLHLVRR